MPITSSHSLPFRIRVAVPVHLYDCFDYVVTEAQYQQASVGARVAVSFGRQNLVGIITEKLAPDAPIDPRFQLKPIQALLDETSLLDTQMLKLLIWSAQYYLFPIGEVLHSAFPTLLRQGKPYDLLAHTWHLIDFDAEAKLKSSIPQQEAYKILKLQPQGTLESILNLSGIQTKTLRTLEKKGIVKYELANQNFSPEPLQLSQMPLKANEDQQSAIHKILKAQHQFKGFLLDGVTGSGKTEVYLQVMHEVLKQGKQVLVLVPEIGLTPQTIARFQSRFHVHIALLHSGLNDAKRLQAWQHAQTGKASIILGTRSAIYTPLLHLGLIILDEEHDLSFKQQDSFRYHARDVALYRAYLHQCPIILGSATPSIDSYALVEQGKLTHLELNQRAGNAHLPKVHLLDLKTARKQQGISQILIEQIEKRLQRKEQVLIFLNRRGYAPVLICEQCAWQANCPHCDARFTLHLKPYQHLHCHHCGLIQRIPDACPQCNHTQLKPLGMGTAKIEESLQALFPDFPVLRVDRDSTSKVGSWQKINDQIHQSQPLILLGTQMLAKGHHFPYVTLVAILDIDSGLLSVDFRATERTAQLIVQVSGRAGRGEHKGEVYLQSLRPDHPLFTTLINKDYRSFAMQTLKERQLAQMPPFRYAALVRSQARSSEQNQDYLQQLVQQLKTISNNEIDIWGPIPAPMERKANRHHAHVLLLAHNRARLHYYLRSWWCDAIKTLPSGMKLSIDIDPQELN
ncbi:primosomal protein N' [Acinetobacter sp. MD2]|uniref:primosomal protein N' n=1 Tax=Acinetobacter sp. MD2 TaxID=2600066 RepID=UPI002D1F922E|nr:primosomal protein N' [Acinetobacter sp. MD2]MEB3767011.1 primosomal protein N' [Acinetobacter sp. MD2]